MKRMDPHRLIRRLTLMLSGEAIQSGFHFALSIVLLQVLSARDFGVFSIVMVVGGLGLTYVRALTAMPATVLMGRSRTTSAVDAYDVTFGSAAVILSILIAFCVDLLLNVWLSNGAFAGACFVGLWSLRSHLRITFFARGRQKVVTIGDVAFILSGALAAAALWTGSADFLPRVFVALTAANGIGMATMLLLSRRPFRISYRFRIRQRYARLWRQLGWSGVSVTVANLQGQIVALMVTLFGGPAAYAPIAATLVLFTPVRIAATVLANMMQPEFTAELAQGEIVGVWRQAKLWSLFAGFAGLAYGVAMIAILPRIDSYALRGSPVQLIGLFACVIYTVIMVYVMPRIVLEALTAFRTIALITAGAGAVGAALIAVILLVATPPFALAGGAAAEILVAVASWMVLHQRLHEPTASAGDEIPRQLRVPRASPESAASRTRG